MNRLFAMFRYSKKLLVLFVCLCVDVCAIAGLCLFDIIQFVLIVNNSAMLSKAFLPLNIALIVLVCLNVALFVTIFILKKHQEKKDELKKD